MQETARHSHCNPRRCDRSAHLLGYTHIASSSIVSSAKGSSSSRSAAAGACRYRR